MQIWKQASDIPADLGSSVVTIGNFDGVHYGHRQVVAQVTQAARDRDALAVAITFDPHPLAVLHPERAPELLTEVNDRLILLAEAGLDAVWVMEFTRELALWSPERFVREVLVDALHASCVVVGRDTRFGHKNSGDVSTLRELGAQLGFTVQVVTDVGQHAGAAESVSTEPAARWSSSQVRELLAAGDVAGAAQVLGRPHWVSGEVVHGDHRGRELGYPTANLPADPRGLIPADGVYAGWLVRHPDDPARLERLPAAISVGTNPTFDGAQRRVEAYVLDRTDLDLYGEQVRYEFVQLLRPTLRFDSAADLIDQMARDVDHTRTALGVGG